MPTLYPASQIHLPTQIYYGHSQIMSHRTVLVSRYCYEYPGRSQDPCTHRGLERRLRWYTATCLRSSRHNPASNPSMPIIHNHPVLEFAILSTRISVAPQAVSSSITFAIFSFNTIELTAAHVESSSAVIVGARMPGVIFVAVSRRLRSTLYWQRTYFWAADERS